MAQQTINLGTVADDGTGDTLRVGGDKINDNFTELYTDKLNKSGGTMTGDLIVPDEAYDATAWNGSLEVPTKNAVRDKIESMGGGATALDGLTDVNAPTPSAGDVLTWDDTPGEWVAAAPSGGGAFALDDATDVDAAAPNDGDVLTWVDADSEWQAVAPSGGASGWTLAATWTYSSNVANVDFTGLAGATDIMVVARGITFSASTVAILRVSTNNGSSYYAASGDYVSIASSGAESATTGMTLWGTNATAARSGIANVHAADVVGAPRPLTNYSVDGTNNLPRLFVADTANDIDAIRVAPNAAANITGGAIYVFTR